MRSLRSFSLAFILCGLSFFAIAPSSAFAETLTPVTSFTYHVQPVETYNMQEDLELDAILYQKPLGQYHYSYTDIVNSGYTYDYQQAYTEQHTDMFGGYLDVPSVNTTASGTVSTHNSDNTGNDNGLFWDPNWYFAPYKRSGDTQWGYKPMQTNSSDHYNAWRLYMYLNTTSNMTASGYRIDMSNATKTSSVIGNGTGDGTATETGTIEHESSVREELYVIHVPDDLPQSPYYMVNIGVDMPVNQIISNGTKFKMKTYNSTVYVDNPNTSYANNYNMHGWYELSSDRKKILYHRYNKTNIDVLTASRNDGGIGVYMLFGSSLYNKRGKDLLVHKPDVYFVDRITEETIQQETQLQTQQLKDTTGSDTTVTNAQGVFNNTIKSKLGFVAQTADITTGLFDALTYEGEGTVPFPALQWEGHTIIAAQNVPILGYIPDIEDDVKTGVTLVLFLAWLHGIHSLYARMFLGETMVEVDEQ